MANSASDAGGSEYEIRKKMIEEGIVSQMVTLPPNMFSSVTLPATLWFFDKAKAKSSKKDEILFIDAREIYTQVDRAHRKFSDEQINNLGIITRLYNGDNEAFRLLIAEYREKMEAAPIEDENAGEHDKAYWQAQIDWLTERFPEGVYTDVVGLCKVAKLDGEDGIIDQDYSLNTGRYVGVNIVDDGLTVEQYRTVLRDLTEEYQGLVSKSVLLEKKITGNIERLLGGLK